MNADSNAVRDRFSHLGVGVFETFRMRAIRPGEWAIPGFELHLRRLEHGAQVLSCPLPDYGAILKKMREQIASAAASDLRTRIVVTRSDWTVECKPFAHLAEIENGVAVVPVHAERYMPEIKSCSALISVLAREEAEGQGAFEALLVDRTGIVREGAWSNIFWLDANGIWHTPASNLLPGVTREIVGDLIVQSSVLHREDHTLELIKARAAAAFLTQSTHGVIPISELDGKDLDIRQSLEVRRRYEAAAWTVVRDLH